MKSILLINSNKNLKLMSFFLLLSSILIKPQGISLIDALFHSVSGYAITKINVNPKAIKYLPVELQKTAQTNINAFTQGFLFGTTSQIWYGTKKSLHRQIKRKEIKQLRNYIQDSSQNNKNRLLHIKQVINQLEANGTKS